MSRGRISTEEYASSVAVMPVISSYFNWEFDPAASGDRIRLFLRGKGEVLAVYSDGRWNVDDPDPGVYKYAASGTEPSLTSGMQRAVKVALALGWEM